MNERPRSLRDATEAALKRDQPQSLGSAVGGAVEERDPAQPMSLQDAIRDGNVTTGKSDKPGDDEEWADPEGEEAHSEVPDNGTPPDWAIIPDGMKLPRNGKRIYFFKFEADWTDTPKKGDRQCIAWPLTFNDERLSLVRCQGDQLQTLPQYTRTMIRAIDGQAVDWTKRPSNLDGWWEDIGARCRSLLQSHYIKTHQLTPEQAMRFFGSCVGSIVSV